jgi:hypothetical protein
VIRAIWDARAQSARLCVDVPIYGAFACVRVSIAYAYGGLARHRTYKGRHEIRPALDGHHAVLGMAADPVSGNAGCQVKLLSTAPRRKTPALLGTGFGRTSVRIESRLIAISIQLTRMAATLSNQKHLILAPSQSSRQL